MVHKTLHGKLRIEQDESKTGVQLSYAYDEKSYSVISNETRKKEGIVTIARGAHP